MYDAVDSRQVRCMTNIFESSSPPCKMFKFFSFEWFSVSCVFVGISNQNISD